MAIDRSVLADTVHRAGKTLTQQRLIVIEALENGTLPMSAYELRDKINSKGENLNISTVYRGLDFWIRLGMIHKIESANRFIVCNDEHKHQFHVIQHCIRCESVEESCELASQMNMQLSNQFKAFENQVVEIQGMCTTCQLRATS